jgi:hypothetical protein
MLNPAGRVVEAAAPEGRDYFTGRDELPAFGSGFSPPGRAAPASGRVPPAVPGG